MRKLIFIIVLFFSTSLIAEGFKYLCEEDEKHLIFSKKDFNTRYIKSDNLEKFFYEKKIFENGEATFLDGSKFNNQIFYPIDCHDMHIQITCVEHDKSVYFNFSQNKFSLIQYGFSPDKWKQPSVLEYSFGYCYD
tara:strand:- start:143 stop:547 length:405 start_codon:yes stop_codon:yes gene_type:complete